MFSLITFHRTPCADCAVNRVLSPLHPYHSSPSTHTSFSLSEQLACQRRTLPSAQSSS